MRGFFFIGMTVQTLHKYFLKSSGVCTDTRAIQPNCIFFALKGDRFDGNEFALQALTEGAAYAVIDNDKYQVNDKTILVADVLQSLQELARYHRQQFDIPIIGLTGSNGKTTTKELIKSVLSQRYHTLATVGNLNNHIGVPLTLLKLDAAVEIAVVEMGANHPGEIKMLSEIALPNFGYITNFGKAHLEGFGSLDGVIKAKTELYRFLQYTNGKTFANGYNATQMKLSEHTKRIVFGPAHSDYPVSLVNDRGSLVVQYKQTEMQSNLTGAYNFENIAAAIAVGAYFQLNEEAIKKGIESYVPSNHRSQIITLGSNVIFMDAYNANPTSMKAALENFIGVEGSHKIVFLGDMFELGKDSAAEHQQIVDFLLKNFEGAVYLIGENFYKTTIQSPQFHKFKSYSDAISTVKTHTPENAKILIKGSRGMALERLLDIL